MFFSAYSTPALITTTPGDQVPPVFTTVDQWLSSFESLTTATFLMDGETGYTMLGDISGTQVLRKGIWLFTSVLVIPFGTFWVPVLKANPFLLTIHTAPECSVLNLQERGAQSGVM